ncbi:N-acetyltransferase, partial [Salmonella enterica]|nr:N-acetyltransferase [Salmonella enterica]
RLFPDSKLINESPDIVKDISHANSIHKIYICGMPTVTRMKRGDIIVIYRTGDGQGPAHYRAVASTLCVVESVKTIDDFRNEDSFVEYCLRFSVFSEEELRCFYKDKRYPYVIRFSYNISLPKRPNRATLIDQVGLNDAREFRWSHFQLTDEQFFKIIELGRINESFIIH